MIWTCTAHEARVVLDVTEGGEYRGYAGDWARLLCQFALKCDRQNRDKLRLAFPEMVDAVDLYEQFGLRPLKAMAEPDEAEEEQEPDPSGDTTGGEG